MLGRFDLKSDTQGFSTTLPSTRKPLKSQMKGFCEENMSK
jgi:hypothetical protein